MEDQWHYECEGAVQGPVSLEELRSALISRQIEASCLVWRKGFPEWRPLEEVEELAELMEELPPPLPTPEVSEEPPPLPTAEVSEDPPPSPPPPPPPTDQTPGGDGDSLDRPEPSGSGDSPTQKKDKPRWSERMLEGASAGAAGVLTQYLLKRKEKARQRERRPREGQGGVERPGGFFAWLSKLIGGFAEGCGNALGQLLVNQPVATAVTVTVIVSSATYIIVRPDGGLPGLDQKPGSAAVGLARIDANPWGEVRGIRAADGSKIEVPSSRTTPVVISLPSGRYEVELVYPPSSATRSCSVQVEAGETATCWVDLAPVNADSYLQRIGW